MHQNVQCVRQITGRIIVRHAMAHMIRDMIFASKTIFSCSAQQKVLDHVACPWDEKVNRTSSINSLHWESTWNASHKYNTQLLGFLNLSNSCLVCWKTDAECGSATANTASSVPGALNITLFHKNYYYYYYYYYYYVFLFTHNTRRCGNYK